MSFDLPQHYPTVDIFGDILNELDPGFGNIDSIAFLERIEPVFDAFENLTRPRHYNLHESKSKRSTRRDHYIFARGFTKDGTMGYRIVTIDASKALHIHDIDQLASDTRLQDHKAPVALRKKYFTTVARIIASRQKATLSERHKQLARDLPGGITPIDDFGFMADGNAQAYKDMRSAEDFFAIEMTRQLDDLIKDNNALRTHLYRALKQALGRFTAKRAAQEAILLKEAHAQLHGDITKTLGINPSSRTLTNYNWALYPDEKISFGETPQGHLRRAYIRACPIITLVDGYQEIDGYKPLSYHIVSSLKMEKDGRLGIDPDELVMNLFEIKTRSRAKYYQRLTEKHIAPEIAYDLFPLSAYVERSKPHVPQPRAREDWQRVRYMWDVVSRLGNVLERYHPEVFTEIASQGYPAIVDDVLHRHFNLNSSGVMSYDRIQDVKVWKHRVATLPLVHKVLAKAKAQQLKLPVRHAFYMVAGQDLSLGDLTQNMPRQLVTEVKRMFDVRYEDEGGVVFGHQNLSNMLLRGVPVTDILDKAFYFGTSHGQESETLNREIFTRRMYGRAEDVTLPGDFPQIPLSFGYSLSKIRTQLDLTTICHRLNSLSVFEGVDAVLNRSHFFVLTHGAGRTRALVKLKEPEIGCDGWQIERIESMPGSGANEDQFEDFVQEAIQSDLFKASYDREGFETVRHNLQKTLSRRAPDEVLTRINPYDPNETGDYLDQHLPHMLTSEPWGLDENGCISSRAVDKTIDQLIQLIRPYYGGASGARTYKGLTA